ncbi:hypothetical protein KL86DPRO_60224 [uncultured delta proteobacterium]|uniref:Uncharacterized protein n=1 Tax=uncultured delta proteobacterium TaxID=34034 RepID=A0A212KFV3_9DELT|nr:hypothetical protein KL86DPRO_60224 [uncultured delta proteobacterium]
MSFDAPSRHTMIYNAEPLILFSYNQSGQKTLIRIASRQTSFERMVDDTPHRGHALTRNVRFILCGKDLSNSFPALSTALALVKIYEHRQFGAGTKKMTMGLPQADDEYLQLFCESISYKDQYDGLKIGWITRKNDAEAKQSHVMHIGYVHHFRNALHRAMGWIAPAAEIAAATLTAKIPPKRPVDSVAPGKKSPRELFELPSGQAVRTIIMELHGEAANHPENHEYDWLALAPKAYPESIRALRQFRLIEAYFERHTNT